MSTAGVTPPAVPDTLDLSMRIDNSATQVINFSLSPTLASQTKTFFFTDTGVTGGSPRCGMIRGRITAVNTTALAASQYNVNSDDATGEVLPTGSTVTQRDQGWIRGTTTSATTANITSLGSAAFTGTYAYPDSVFIRTTLGAVSYSGKTITNSIAGILNSAVSPSGTTYDSTFSSAILATNFTNAITSRLVSVAALQSSDLATGTDWTVLTQTTQTITIDPRLTFAGVSRTSPLAVVNFGLHTITGTFLVHTARGVNLNATTHGSFANIRIVSRDLTAPANEGQSAASITPAGSPPETYSLSFTFPGPTLSASRGTGTRGDTAAHDQVGKIKGLLGNPTSDAANTFISSATFVSLSDLYRLDVHNQKVSTLAPDADPYVEPGSNEAKALTIGSDQLFMWGFCGDVNGAAIGGASLRLALFDPNGTASAEGETSFITVSSGANTGYTINYAQFQVLAPSGNWKSRARIDIGDTGSNGNYGNTTLASAMAPMVVGSRVEAIPFVSPYTANREFDIQVIDEVSPGDAVQTVYVRYVDNTGAVLALDASPAVQIYSIGSDGSLAVDLVSLLATRIGSTFVYLVVWNPGTSAGNYLVEATGSYLSSPIRNAIAVSIRPRYVFDPTGMFK